MPARHEDPEGEMPTDDDDETVDHEDEDEEEEASVNSMVAHMPKDATEANESQAILRELDSEKERSSQQQGSSVRGAATASNASISTDNDVAHSLPSSPRTIDDPKRRGDNGRRPRNVAEELEEDSKGNSLQEETDDEEEEGAIDETTTSLDEVHRGRGNGKRAHHEDGSSVYGRGYDNTVSLKTTEPQDEVEDESRVQKRSRFDSHDGVRSTTPPYATVMQQQPAHLNPGDSYFGVYLPPHKRKQQKGGKQQQRNDLQAAAVEQQQAPSTLDKSPNMQTQRQYWEDLKKTFNGTINRLNSSTIKPLIHQLFKEANLIRGKGLLAKTVLRAAVTSPTYSNVYAALISVINTKLPEIGELIITRAILLFRRSYKRREKAQTVAVVTFLGNLFNQGLCHELLSLQMLTVLLDGDPTDDSVEVAVVYMKVVGQALTEASPAGVHAVMERFRGLLHDGSIGKRVQFKVEELMKERKKNFADFPSVLDELDLVEREEQITFEMGLDDEDLKKEEGLDIFRFDDDWYENERTWENIRKEILGEDDDDSSSKSVSSGNEDTNSTEESVEEADADDEVPDQELSTNKNDKLTTVIQDFSESDLVHLRRTIYLTIMSSATFEECTHKLTKIDIPPGRESELINMIIECCSQERTFLRYYGLIAGRFCLLHDRWREAFEHAFTEQYTTIHRLETNKLRNVAKLFAHLLHTDSLPWSVLSIVHLNEDETTSSSRIFIKILVQEMAEALGIARLQRRFEMDQPQTIEWYRDMFPKDNPKNTRYAINFFTSIGLGPLTDGLREHLKNVPKLILAQAQAAAAAKAAIEDDQSVISSNSSSTSSTSSSSSSVTSSGSSSYTSYSSSSSYSTSSYDRRDRKGASRSSRSYNRERRSQSYSSRSYSSEDSYSTRDSSRSFSRSVSRSESPVRGHERDDRDKVRRRKTSESDTRRMTDQTKGSRGRSPTRQKDSKSHMANSNKKGSRNSNMKSTTRNRDDDVVAPAIRKSSRESRDREVPNKGICRNEDTVVRKNQVEDFLSPDQKDGNEGIHENISLARPSKGKVNTIELPNRSSNQHNTRHDESEENQDIKTELEKPLLDGRQLRGSRSRSSESDSDRDCKAE